MTFLWGLLAKTTEDSTTIDEEIDAKIEAHNDDPDAHNLADQALEVHRQSEVIDHLAESIVNDKIRVTSRNYVAIVDPSDEEAFDTLAGAVTYADTKGGGNIYLVAGTHQVGTDIVLNRSINLYGEDRDTTILVANQSTGGVIMLPNQTDDGTILQEFKNINFKSDNGPFFQQTTTSLTYDAKMLFSYCKFSNNGEYFNAIVRNLTLNDCIVECDTSVPFYFEGILNFIDCDIRATNSSGTTNLFENKGDGELDLYVLMRGNTLLSFSSSACAWLGDGTTALGDIMNNHFDDLITTVLESEIFRFMNNLVVLNSSGYLSFDVNSSIITGNRFLAGSGNRLRLASGSVKCIATSNNVGTSITNSGTSNIVADNVTT